jgi:hypothetical protein
MMRGPGCITQHRIEHNPGLPPADRIDPYEHSDRQKLFAHLAGNVLVINRGFGMMPSAARSSKTRKNRLFCGVAARRSCGTLPRRAIIAPGD